MTTQEIPEQDSAREDDRAWGPRAIARHSLAAAAICLVAGATIALIAIFGQPG